MFLQAEVWFMLAFGSLWLNSGSLVGHLWQVAPMIGQLRFNHKPQLAHPNKSMTTVEGHGRRWLVIKCVGFRFLSAPLPWGRTKEPLQVLILPIPEASCLPQNPESQGRPSCLIQETGNG